MAKGGLIEEGTYQARVSPLETSQGLQACQFGKSKLKKTLEVLVAFEITKGKYEGRKLSWFGYFTENTNKRVAQSLRHCGFKGIDIEKFPFQEPKNEVQIVVEHEEYNGRMRAKVAWVNKGSGLIIEKPLEGKDLKSFSSKMKDVFTEADEDIKSGSPMFP